MDLIVFFWYDELVGSLSFYILATSIWTRLVCLIDKPNQDFSTEPIYLAGYIFLSKPTGYRNRSVNNIIFRTCSKWTKINNILD